MKQTEASVVHTPQGLRFIYIHHKNYSVMTNEELKQGGAYPSECTTVIVGSRMTADGSMILGSPAKVVRQLTPEQIEGLRWSARHYIENARRFRTGLKRIG